MNFEIGKKKLQGFPIYLKIFCAFFIVCCGLSLISGGIYYKHSKEVVLDSIREQALLVCEHIAHEFTVGYSAPIERELQLFTTSPQLNNYLMSSKIEAPIYRAEVEELFLDLLGGSKIGLSTMFLDSAGNERISVYGKKRKRIYRSLEEIAEDGLLGQNLRALFEDLKFSEAKRFSCSEPFYDSGNRLSILVGITKQEPEAGGFGGAIIQHCDLTGFIDEISAKKVLNTAVMWVYKSNWEVLLSPPDDEVQQNPKGYLVGEEQVTGSYIYTTKCKLFGSKKAVMTVVCSVPRKVVSKELVPIIWSVMAVFSGLLIVSVIGSFLISALISTPIGKLTQATEEISKGNLDIELAPKLVKSKDEIGILASAFKKMTVDLKKSTTSIDNLNAEIRVRKRAEELLRESEERYRKQFEGAMDAIFLADAETGILIDCNPAAMRLVGMDKSELIGKHQRTLHPQGKGEKEFSRTFKNHLGEKHDQTLETQIITKTGEIKDVAIKASLLEIKGKKVLQGIFRDITERKRSEEELKKLLSLHTATLEATADGILVVDLNGRVVSYNQQFLELLKVPDSLAQTRDDEKLLSHILDQLKDAKGFLAEVHRLYSHPEEESLDLVGFKDGRVFERLSKPQKFGERIVGRVWSFRDITESRKAERRQASLLEELEKINQELKEFAYIVSHDLKAPLRGIKSIIGFLAADYAEKFDEDGQKQVELLVSRVDRMQALIEGVLNYSRVGRIGEEKSVVDFNSLLPEIIDLIASPENISITIENKMPVIMCERTRISQVFQNLLSNAVKYMDKPDGRIQVGCTEEADFWKFSVSDNGPGIEEKHFEKIFKVFQTLNRRDEVEGTGIGLSVVKKIVCTYGGNIWVESEVGKGSTFYFTLPIYLRAPESAMAEIGAKA